MKKCFKQFKRGFTVAELLISMLVVMVVLTALAPIIGPKKARVPGGGMSALSGNGIFECYWDLINPNAPENIDSWQLKSVLRERTGNVIEDVCNKEDEHGKYCEFQDRSVNNNAYTLYSVGAGGGVNIGGVNIAENDIGNIVAFKFLADGESDPDAINHDIFINPITVSGKSLSFQDQIARASVDGIKLQDAILAALGTVKDNDGNDINNADFRLQIETPLGAPEPTFVKLSESGNNIQKGRPGGKGIRFDNTDGTENLKKIFVNSSTNFSSIASLISNAEDCSKNGNVPIKCDIKDKMGGIKKGIDIDLGNTIINIAGSDDYAATCSSCLRTWDDALGDFTQPCECVADKAEIRISDKDNSNNFKERVDLKDYLEEISGVEPPSGVTFTNRADWNNVNDKVLKSKSQGKAGTIAYNNLAFQYSFTGPRAEVSYITAGGNGGVRIQTLKTTGQTLRLYPAPPVGGGSTRIMTVDGEVTKLFASLSPTNGLSGTASPKKTYNVDATESFPLPGSVNDLFSEDPDNFGRIFINDNENESFPLYIGAISQKLGDNQGLSNCVTQGNCPGYGAPAYYPIVNKSDWDALTAQIFLTNGSIHFHTKNFPVDNLIPEVGNNYEPKCGSGLLYKGDDAELSEGNYTGTVYCKSNNHDHRPRGGAVVITW